MVIKYAPAWKRLVAYVIDFIFVNALTVIVIAVFSFPIQLSGWFFGIVYLIYNVIADYKFEGTLGKGFMKLKVIKTNGQRPDLLSSFYRNFGKFVSALPLYWGFIRILTPSFPQAIHDEIARCYVIEK